MNNNPIHLRAAIELPVSTSTAWRFIADYAHDVEWRSGVRAMSSEPPGVVVVGAQTAEELRFGGTTYRNLGEVTAVEHERSLSWRTTSGADARGSRSLEPLGGERCRLTLELTVVPSGRERLLAPILVRLLARNLRRDVRRARDVLASRPVSPSAASGIDGAPRSMA